MNRDVITTVGGLVVVGVVVVATFLYGNHQHQAQLRHDQAIQRQQSVQKHPAKTTVATGTTAVQQQPAVETPSSSAQSSLQGGSQSKPAATATGTTATSTPDTGGSAQPAPQSMPNTGSGVFYLIGATLMVLSYHMYRRSRVALQRAALRS